MKKIILCLSFCFIVLGSFGQSSVALKEVRQTVMNFINGIAERNISEVQKNSTADLIIFESGKQWNIDSITTKISAMQKMNISRKYSFDFIETEIRGEVAWVSYYNNLDMHTDNKAIHKHWLETALLVRVSETWKIKLLHSTNLEKEN